MGKEEIKTVEAFTFAGKLYADRIDAERDLTRSDLREYLLRADSTAQDGGFIAGDNQHARDKNLDRLISFMERDYEKIIKLLNGFY